MTDKAEVPEMNVFSPLNGLNETAMAQFIAALYYVEGIHGYNEDFFVPFLMATENFSKLEAHRFLERPPVENFQAYSDMFSMNFNLLADYNQGILKSLGAYSMQQMERFYSAWHAAVFNCKDDGIREYFADHQNSLRRVLEEYPEAIAKIEPEYGFHFERYPDNLAAESERFYLFQVSPIKEGVKTDDSMKPIIIVPPFVLGANILAFLPNEQKSYAHAYANKGIPTYIKIMKDIQSHEAVQAMTLEEDTLDTKYFCEVVKTRHGREVTLNGYCQGGFSSLCSVLTGRLDGLVDALITCVAPMDGTRSKGLGTFLDSLPKPFNDLAYGSKILPNGNKVANGDLMGWVYKLKSMEDSGPLVAFIRDLMMLNVPGTTISKTVAALNYWLQNERSDLPMSVTQLSYSSYNIPVTEDGELPIRIFDESLNFKTLNEKNIPWLICYGERDDLVEKEVALAPLDYIKAEVTPFPKGHVAIATSWSHPDSVCPLDGVFGKGKHRGPVRFHLDLE